MGEASAVPRAGLHRTGGCAGASGADTVSSVSALLVSGALEVGLNGLI